ncbi:MAG: BrnT family toxin [Microcystaceae cyanobacterium]
MNFDWDNNKNQSNLTKDGISFDEAIALFDDPNILTFEDDRFNYGETRFISIGQITLVTQSKKVIIVVVHTQRNQTIRLISARKANERERKSYEQQ